MERRLPVIIIRPELPQLSLAPIAQQSGLPRLLHYVLMSFLLYVGVCGFLLGIALRSFLVVDLEGMVWSLLMAFALALVYHREKTASSAVFLLYGALFLACLAVGMFRMEIATWFSSSTEHEANLAQKVVYDGMVARESEAHARATHLYVRTGGETILVITDRHHPAEYGDTVHVEGMLQKPEAFETELGRIFNYEGYLHARGVSYVIPFAEVTVTDTKGGNPILSALFAFKHAFMENLEAAIPSPHAGLGEGLLLGVKQALGEDLETAFVKTGITHIVVLSGYNIMLVIVFVMYVLSYLLPFRGRLIFGMGAIIAFALVVGLSATVLRASLMAVFILVAKLSGRTYDVLRALLIAGVCMLLWNPYLLVFDIGFQLSFIATLGLILLAPHLERMFHFMPQAFGLREFLTATVAAQLFVTPLLLYQMGQFSVVSVVVNVLVLPMVPIAMLASFVTGMVGFVSSDLAHVVGLCAYWSLSYILFIAETFAALPFASFTVPPFPFVFVVGAYAFLAYGMYMLESKAKRTFTMSLKGWTIIREEDYRATLQKKEKPVFFT